MTKYFDKYNCHRLNMELFKVLLGLNLVLLKFLLVWIQMGSVTH